MELISNQTSHGRWPTGARAMFCAVGSTGIPADHALLRRRLEALANLGTDGVTDDRSAY